MLNETTTESESEVSEPAETELLALRPRTNPRDQDRGRYQYFGFETGLVWSATSAFCRCPGATQRRAVMRRAPPTPRKLRAIDSVVAASLVPPVAGHLPHPNRCSPGNYHRGYPLRLATGVAVSLRLGLVYYAVSRLIVCGKRHERCLSVRPSVRLSVCPVDRQQQRRLAGLLLRSGAASRYRSTAAAAGRHAGRVNFGPTDCEEIQHLCYENGKI